jgi:alkylated DNA repair dioxygenase AlkB
MTLQSNFLDSAGDASALQPLEGFRYRAELITPADESALLARLRELPFREFEFHGYTGKRRVVSFGWQYDFSGRKLRKTADIPEFLKGLRALAASFARLEPAALQQALITEYGPGAGIGWHRDKAVFGQVVGISLLTPCILRFRRKKETVARSTSAEPNVRATSKQILKREWERVNVFAEPRSAYHLSGPARSVWEHSILRVEALRYSITFRNVGEDQAAKSQLMS